MKRAARRPSYDGVLSVACAVLLLVVPASSTAAAVVSGRAASSEVSQLGVQATRSTSSGESSSFFSSAAALQHAAVQHAAQQHRAGGGTRHGARRAAATSNNARSRLANARAKRSNPLYASTAPYIPVIGVANVTTPTAYPPPPPQLDSVRDMQPMDTAIGNFLAGSFIQDPTVTPPPAQAALDVAFGCPALLEWENKVVIYAPDPCGESQNTGKWEANNEADTVLLNWTESCGAFDSTLSLITYSMSNGDLFGYSKSRITLVGNFIDLLDCQHKVKFTIQEKVYEQTNSGGSDHQHYLQYFITNPQGTIIAETPYLVLGQAPFVITDHSGVKIADVSHMGDWSATDTTCRNDRFIPKWLLTFSNPAPGMWSTPTNQWPIAEMMTMISLRDIHRRTNGMVSYTSCEAFKISVIVGIVLGILGIGVIFGLIFMINFRHGLFIRLQRTERQLCPRRMFKPEKYEGS